MVDSCGPEAGFDPASRQSGRVLVIVAPGQGAQTPGFLTPWLEDPTFASRFAWLSTVADLDLAHYGTEADAETIRDTKIAQPLLVATGLVAALELFPQPADAFEQVGAVAGHSVGEIAAAAGARVITAEQAMVLVRERGNAMARAAAATPTGMTAVLGGDRDEVLAALDKHGLTPANDNGPGQVVAAGTREQLEALAAEPPAKARLMPLSVAGAFHTRHMEPAVGHLAALARSVSVHDPRTRVISNRDGTVVHDGREVLARIVGQIASPVRWDLCLETMEDLGVTGILEMPPAGTLTGIAKRALRGVETFALKTPDQLDDARAFCAKHGESSGLGISPTWRMVVSPAKGTFHQAAAAAGSDVLEPGAAVGEVASLRDRTLITAAHGGTIVEWLVEDGDLVSPGQPLLRLHPEGGA
jgi:[acyl-carrier-protein] S-malonyltransferase